MAHPKLALVNRSLIAASAAALLAGPMAALGGAASLDAVVDSTGKVVTDLTCEEALETEDIKLIEGFCDPDELPEPVDEPVRKTKKTAEKTADSTEKVVESTVSTVTGGKNDDENSSGGGGSTAPDSPTESVLPGGGSGGSESNKPSKGNKVQQSSNGGFRPVSDGRRSDTGGVRGSGSRPTYNEDGPFRGGMGSYSTLTLQPFAEPVVSVPPIYELPQIAQQLFTGSSDEMAATPIAASGEAGATDPGAFAPASYSATPADPTGWLAATATGLIMLVGAGHALNGGRTPRRQRAQ